MRWRVWFDRLIVLLILLAAWQAGSLWLGNYWLSSPWAVATRFVASLLNGELIFHAGYTIDEAVVGCVIGGVPAVLLPFLLRRHPIVGRDPRSVHGRRLRRAQARVRAAVHPVVRHRHRIQDRAGRGRGVLHRLFRDAVGRARARAQARADGAGHGRQRAPGRPPHRVSRRGAGDLRRLPHRRALRHRRRGDRRADLVEPRARLSGADRRDELRHHAGVRRDPRRDDHRACLHRRHRSSASASCCAGGRAARR